MSIVIRHRSWLSLFQQTLERALPSPIRRAIEGRAQAVTLGDDDVKVGSWPRSIDLLIPSELVLKTRLPIPKSSRGDLRHAVDLMLHEKTPFTRAEVLIEAKEEQRGTDDEHAVYAISILPLSVLERAKEQVGRSLKRVSRIATVEPSGDVIETGLTKALFPSRRYTAWLPLVPFLVLLSAIAVYCSEDLSGLRAQVNDLNTTLQEETSVATVLTKKADARKTAASGSQVVADAIRNRSSVFSMLEKIRKLLPPVTHVTGIDALGGEMKVSVRSANVLKDVQALSMDTALGHPAVDGAIIADPRGPGEIGTIVLPSLENAK